MAETHIMDVSDMPKYVCKKEVRALELEAVNGVTLVFVDKRYGATDVNLHWIGKHAPKAGGYFVVYRDGYTSYSPKAAFEEGYDIIGN